MTKFWADDIKVLWSQGAWRDFLPTLGAPLNEVLNSLMRFVLLSALVISIYYQNLGWLFYLGIPAAVLLILAHQVIGDDSGELPGPSELVWKADTYRDDDSDLFARPDLAPVPIKRLFPTHHNPYANPSAADLGDGMMVLPPKNPDSARVRDAIRATAYDEISRDERDMFDKNRSQGLTHFSVAGAPYGDPLGEFRAFLAKDMVDKPTGKELHSNYGPVSIHQDPRHVPRKGPYPYLSE